MVHVKKQMNCSLMFNHFAVILPCCIAGACPRGIERLGRPSWLLCNGHVLRINREIFDSAVIVRRELDCSKRVGTIVVLRAGFFGLGDIRAWISTEQTNEKHWQTRVNKTKTQRAQHKTSRLRRKKNHLRTL